MSPALPKPIFSNRKWAEVGIIFICSVAIRQNGFILAAPMILRETIK